MRFFLVENSPEFRERLRSVLFAMGTVVGEADKEEDAVHDILQLQPDVVILDLALADGNGIEVLRKIKVALPEIRVIVLSNYSGKQYQDKCREFGAENFLSKDREFDLLEKSLT